MATKRSTSYLNGLWITGYTPTQSDFEDLFVSYQNIVDNSFLDGKTANLAAVYPSVQSTAAQVTTLNTRVLGSGTPPGGVKLPAMVQGTVGYINNQSNGSVNVYPATGEGIQSHATNAPFLLQVNQVVMFVGLDAGLCAMFLYTDGLSNVRVYKGLVSQSGTAAPTVTVLENTLGDVPVWGYVGVGSYSLVLTGAFPAAKTLLSYQTASDTAASMSAVGGDTVYLNRFFLDGTYSDGITNGDTIQIIVYP